MAGSSTVPRATGLGDTNRSNSWLIENIPVIVVLSAFGLYATLRAFEGKFYEWGPYLSPFYSPLIDPHHHWWPFSPAILILGGSMRRRGQRSVRRVATEAGRTCGTDGGP